MKLVLFVITATLILSCTSNSSYKAETDISGQSSVEKKSDDSFVEITIEAADGIKVTADVYNTGNPSASWIVLCHQAGFSRGEYRGIAPKLNVLGYNCIAIDQRSGKAVNSVENQTHRRAKEADLPTEYPNAIPDIKAALDYVTSELNAEHVILWGSSYSAALTFIMAANNPDQVDAIVAFSPGEYFKVDGKGIAEFSTQVNCPVFISSAKNENEQWKGIYEKVDSPKSFHLPVVDGIHGSRGLWESTKGHKAVWTDLKKYLSSL